ARREAGLVEDERAPGIGDDAIAMTDHEVTGGLSDVDAVVAVSSVAENPFVFFVKGIHGRPGERDPLMEFTRVDRQVPVLPCPSLRTPLTRMDGVPSRQSEVGMARGVLCALQAF